MLIRTIHHVYGNPKLHVIFMFEIPNGQRTVHQYLARVQKDKDTIKIDATFYDYTDLLCIYGMLIFDIGNLTYFLPLELYLDLWTFISALKALGEADRFLYII